MPQIAGSTVSSVMPPWAACAVCEAWAACAGRPACEACDACGALAAGVWTIVRWGDADHLEDGALDDR
ncbi:MAG: hypothetical protein ACJ79L_11530 [Anaeromyxobacteraceae bacterium]